MMKDSNFIKRPLVLGKKTVFGFKPEEYDKL